MRGYTSRAPSPSSGTTPNCSRWLAPGTECVLPVLADGTPVHQEPLESRYAKPRTVRRGRWFGTVVLKLARPGEPWSVWLFWEPGWRF
ncbi:hypothetical protein SFUMM280S_03890 [Streptomyces fumanus]